MNNMKGWWLDPNSIVHFADVVAEVVGQNWLRRKIRQWSTRQRPRKPWKDTPAHALPRHPLVYWFAEYEQWQQEGVRTGRFDVSAIVMKLAVLGRALERTRSQGNFQKLTRRLKSSEEFHAAAFEAEVAASYVAQGWMVEFIEESKRKAPDLRVNRDDGVIFWVECKRRDDLTERDKRIKSIWDELESSLLDYLRPRKLNYFIGVKAGTDPERDDVQHLYHMILEAVEAIEQGISDVQSGDRGTIVDPSGRFEIVVHRLSDPDDEMETGRLDFANVEDYDRGVLLSEMVKHDTGKIAVYNPAVVLLGTVIPPDRLSGVVHALKAAVPQLPKRGPGVVWVRVPDNSWGDGVSRFDKRIERLLRKELTGSHNRRVNVVAVQTWEFRQIERNGVQGLAYGPRIIRVEHDNPRTPIDGSHSQ